MIARDDPESRRVRVREGLSALASGRFAERLRLEAAASLLILTHRALMAVRGGFWQGLRGDAPAAALERIIASWQPELLTASEYVESLAPADVTALIELGPLWAEAMLAAEAARDAPLPAASRGRKTRATVRRG